MSFHRKIKRVRSDMKEHQNLLYVFCSAKLTKKKGESLFKDLTSTYSNDTSQSLAKHRKTSFRCSNRKGFG